MFRILLTILLILLAPVTFAKKEVFTMKGDVPTGTRIAPDVVTSAIPLDKPYSELSEEQQAHVKQNYQSMPAGDTPPFPKEGLESIYQPFVDVVSATSKGGQITAVASIDKHGKAQKVAIYRTTGDTMTKAIYAVLMGAEFDPAICDGEPCAMDYLLDLHTEYKL